MEFKNTNEVMIFSNETFTKRVLFADKHMLSFVLNLKAGQKLPAHKHENSTLVLLVLSGSGEIRINDEDESVETGSVVQADGQDDLAIPIVKEDMSVFVCISPNPSNQLYSKEIG